MVGDMHRKKQFVVANQIQPDLHNMSSVNVSGELLFKLKCSSLLILEYGCEGFHTRPGQREDMRSTIANHKAGVGTWESEFLDNT